MNDNLIRQRLAANGDSPRDIEDHLWELADRERRERQDAQAERRNKDQE